MISFKSGNIFESKMETLVNPINCVGVMGKGLVLIFKKKYPEMFNDYKTRCAIRGYQHNKILSSE
jgi:O-acetyl-ADP-ribose deacetylase (regulator of RNase III)